MNFTEMNALLVICAAPVIDIDAPLALRVTEAGRQTVRAHHAPLAIAVTDDGHNVALTVTLTPCPNLCCHNRVLPGEICLECADFADDNA